MITKREFEYVGTSDRDKRGCISREIWQSG